MTKLRFERCLHWFAGTCAIIAARILAPVATQFSKKKRPVRSVWSGTPILTLAIKARSERLLGVEATSLVINSNFITQDFDINLSKLASNRFLSAALRYIVFVWCCCWYDRLNFFMDRGFFQQESPGQFNKRELQVYSLLGKQVFLYAYGADVRTQYSTRSLGEPNCCTDCPSPGFSCICDDRLGHDNIETIRENVTAYFSMGDMIEYTPGSYNDLYYWPIELEKDKYQVSYPSVESDRPIVVAHAPNHRGFKGTHYLIEAVEALKQDGIDIELCLIEKIPNEQALQIYRTADIIFDQCMIGFHGYFALEGMAMGKPVVCFIRKPENYLIKHEECPIINTSITSLKNDLRRLATNRLLLHETGKAGRRYIESNYSLRAFADRLHNAYTKFGVS